jgi:hypothetical protein
VEQHDERDGRQNRSYSVTGPQSSDNYTGPVSFQVYRDNIYGSFMFYPL